MSPTIQDNLLTVGDRQFATWVDDRSHPRIAARTHGATDWRHRDLSDVPGNPLAAPVAEDGHNFFSLGVDRRGHLHLCGNQHNDRLRYVTSTRPLDIGGWATGTMVRDEDRVTYPKFFNLADGTLLFLYRNGRSGLGDTFINRYDEDAGRWERVVKLVDGHACDRSFYPNHVVSRHGVLHVMGVWRRSRKAETTHDVTYFRSRDGGRSWERADGSEQPLPVTYDNAERVVETAPEGSGLLNGGGLEVDSRGRPHGAVILPDEHGTQIQHVWHDGERWQRRPVTRLTGRMDFEGSFADNSVGHPAVAVTRDDRVLVLYRSRAHRPGAPLLVEATPGAPLREHCLADVDLGFWNPVFDSRALHERNELHLLLVPTGNPTAPGADLEPWRSVAAQVLSVRLR